MLQALDELGVLMNGVDVPHYCWHPRLSIDGSCRLCQVEIEGVPKLQIACDTPVVDGMVVHTQNDRVRQAREGVMELLLVNHPLDCPICDQAGECKLQDHAFDYGVPHARTREPRRPGQKRVDLGPTIVFDEERCILCRRCVRFCREIPETGELMVEGRGRSISDRHSSRSASRQPLLDECCGRVPRRCTHDQGLSVQGKGLGSGDEAGRLHRLFEWLQRQYRRASRPSRSLHAASERRDQRDLALRLRTSQLPPDRRAGSNRGALLA